MSRKDPSPQERIDRAKDSIDGGAAPYYAIAHTLIAIAELLSEFCSKPEPQQVKASR